MNEKQSRMINIYQCCVIAGEYTPLPDDVATIEQLVMQYGRSVQITLDEAKEYLDYSPRQFHNKLQAAATK